VGGSSAGRGWLAQLLSTIVALLVLGSGTVVVAGPAYACSCAGGTDADAFASADAVFVGEALERRDPLGAVSSAEAATYVFEVSTVYKGDVRRKQAVLTPVSGASCGLEIPGEGTFVVFANRAEASGLLDNAAPGPGDLMANLCGGTRAVDEAPVALDAAARAPAEGSSYSVTHEPSIPDTGAGRAWLVGLGGLVLLAGAVTVAAAFRRRRVVRREASAS
jgi:hypothetical protein